MFRKVINWNFQKLFLSNVDSNIEIEKEKISQKKIVNITSYL